MLEELNLIYQVFQDVLFRENDKDNNEETCVYPVQDRYDVLLVHQARKHKNQHSQSKKIRFQHLLVHIEAVFDHVYYVLKLD